MGDVTNVYYPGPLALPSDRAWLDPALVGRNLYVRLTDVVVPASGVVPVAVPNPYRWAVGLTLAPASGAGAHAAPWGDVTSADGIALDILRLDWYDLRRYGPLVCGGWFAAGGAGSVVRAIEVIRRTEG